MPDITQLIQSGAHHPWVYLPLAVVLGALHALEPGHSKSMMAAFVIATRGTPAQAALLILVSGLLVMGLAWRIFTMFRHEHDHDHHHGHDHHHDHHHDHDHHHEPALSHDEEHEREIQQKFAGRKVTTGEIAWFGLTAGLMPCPSAVAVLLICLQSRAFTLGFGMVAGFSVGLAITLISVGVLAAWGARKASEGWSGFSGWAERLPLVSAALVGVIGAIITARGLMAVL